MAVSRHKGGGSIKSYFANVFVKLFRFPGRSILDLAVAKTYDQVSMLRLSVTVTSADKSIIVKSPPFSSVNR